MADERDRVAVAVEVTMNDHPENVLAAMYAALFAFRETKDVGHLERFANAALLSADVHGHPGYDPTSASTDDPLRPGRSLEEILRKTG